ncbi:5'-AMP-activated protein kinase subunit beta-1 [Caenorhabditis elegans]|uniref:5'-AMP-activated protein kinase subunit beta-1 n=1 Tax=Caenorhabditis elegans TaxID=6239 RepID=Q9XUY2_CAEEL|nr:Association with the SNF1 complex (ASC) domain-containing protein [Caenorhabditis elegans]CAB04480.1 Association with the SNF1 complex (ASC) domain-containing protein [Caenorhabditis elegans]|eukprot:NP_510298.1 AMP-Activated Kinase Beta subunit [Caenorhabditis elegans]
MGNNQPGGMYKRDRPYDSEKSGSHSRSRGGIPSSSPSNEDECPVQMKIAKGDDKSKFPVVFKWNINNATPRQVYICGSWDGWNTKIPLVKSTSDFSTIVDLEPGKHEYKFMVDSKWVVDDNQQKTGNNLGGENNVVMIDEADFEVFDALDKDLASSNAGEALRNSHPTKESHDTPNDRELEKLHQFGQETPTRVDFNKAAAPPVLPPHLLQVILNKDTPVQCDPNVLPEPDHVMLNHLYALSIKDGVMVLSATHRYRKKFVTTLLYKPI